MLVAVVFAGTPTRTQASEIWMAAAEPIWRTIHGWPPNDYMELFTPNAQWQKAAAVVKVFEVSKRFLLESPEQDVRQVISDLKRRHISLAVQGTPLTAGQQCGLGIEGHGPPHDMALLAQRVKQLGGTIEYVSLDEPLFYGHVYNGRGTERVCHFSIDELAAQTAQKIDEVRRLFPAIRIGDTEPFGIRYPDTATWTSEIAEWLEAYRAAMGEPLAFLRADLVPTMPAWRQQFATAIGVVRNSGVPLGVIYNGTRMDTSDATWIAAANHLCHVVEGQMAVEPAQVAFMTWTDRPHRLLPENQPGTLTNLVNKYAHGCR
jgi:hypothetical protein